MTTTNRAIAAGVFQNESDAQQAMSDLQNAGFTDDQIRYSVHRGGSGILDSLMNLGFGQDEANFYNNEFMNGRTIVTVKSQDRRQEAYDILQRDGAYDMNSRMGQGANYAQSTTTDTTGNYAQSGQMNTDTTGDRVQLREEQLQATKTREQAGEVDIRKNVVSEEQTLNVPVNREEVYVERHPVNNPVSDNAAPIGQGQDEVVRVPVSEEQVQVTKQPVVTEEINVGKRVVQDNQQVTDTVRHEEAQVENQGDVNVVGNNNPVTNNPDTTNS